MMKTYLYIPEPLEKRINRTVRVEKKSKAEVMRMALQEGLDVIDKKNNGGAEVILKLAELSKKYKIKGPRDSSVNHDYYLWGLPKKNPRLKP